jgi:hypothetical protein
LDFVSLTNPEVHQDFPPTKVQARESPQSPSAFDQRIDLEPKSKRYWHLFREVRAALNHRLLVTPKVAAATEGGSTLRTYSTTFSSCVPSTSTWGAAVAARVSRAKNCSRHGCLYKLLVYDLDLLVAHLPGKPVDRNMHPVTLFPLNDEIVLKI